MRHLCFIVFCAIIILLNFRPLIALIKLSFDSELHSHFILIPVVSLYFFVTQRKAIFVETGYSFRIGFAMVVSGLFFYWSVTSSHSGLSQNDYLALMMFVLFVCIYGGFIGFYGTRAYRRGLFPLMFLIFMVPIPMVILDALIKLLLIGSAETSYALFQVLGVPIFRDGFIFELPGLAVEVAMQCSGIRSTIGMLITSVIAGYMLLNTRWGKVLLVLAIFPITIFKNSIRICTISLLAAYVDESWVTDSWLHSSGGIVFFVLGLIILGVVLLIIQQVEKRAQGTRRKVESGRFEESI